MEHTYSNIVGRLKYLLNKKDLGYKFPYLPNYNKTVGNITSGYYNAIVGADSCGKSFFMDNNYILNPLLQWYFKEERPPLKIIYFSNKDSALVKYQKLLCNYVMLSENIRLDVPTLNSTATRLFDIDEEGKEHVLQAIIDAKDFFSEIEDEEILEIVDGRVSASDIYNKVADYMGTMGTDEPDEDYVLDDENEEGLVLVVIDSIESLTRKDEYGSVSKTEATHRIINVIQSLIRRYNVSVVSTGPSERNTYSNNVMDNIPKYEHLGLFGRACNRGIIIYDPIKEGTSSVLDSTMKEAEAKRRFISNGINTLKYWFVVKNDEGADLRRMRLFTVPGTGFFIESDQKDYEVTEFDDVWDVIEGATFKYD